eukprot:5938630-Ditylum_brightwellii.AAC.1
MGRPRMVTPLVTLPSVYVWMAMSRSVLMSWGRKGRMDLPITVDPFDIDMGEDYACIVNKCNKLTN